MQNTFQKRMHFSFCVWHILILKSIRTDVRCLPNLFSVFFYLYVNENLITSWILKQSWGCLISLAWKHKHLKWPHGKTEIAFSLLEDRKMNSFHPALFYLTHKAQTQTCFKTERISAKYLHTNILFGFVSMSF